MAKEETTSKHTFRKIFIIILIALLGLLGWARFIGTSGLIIKEYSITNAKIPVNFHGVKVIHFTDLHYGRTISAQYVKKLVKVINEYKPEIVVFTGDLVDKDVILKKDEVVELGELLKEIDPTLEKYAVKGNHDYEADYFDEAMSIANFIVLNNEIDFIYYQDEIPIKIIGLPSFIKENYVYEPIKEEEPFYTILLAHEPDIIDTINDEEIDVMFSGHSHGGQVRAPFFGAIFTPYGAKHYFDEYYKLDNTEIFISSGLGTSELELRFLNRPSFNLYRLYSY